MLGIGKSTDKTPEALEELIRKGKAKRIGAFFEGMAEPTRREFAPGVVAIAPEFFEFGWLSENSYGAMTDDSVRDAATLAALATGSFTELKKLGWRCTPPMWNAAEQEPYLALLRDRAPDWIDRWAEWLLQENFRHWQFVRRMVREGLCKPPESEFYVLGMIEGIRPHHDACSLADAILADRELLDGLFWRLFEVEGGGELSLAACDKYTAEENSWARALNDLAARGEIDRGRLLDASLDALNRDFAQFRAGWFSRFHEFLDPALEERAARADRYLDLLASPIPPTVSFAMKALLALHKAKSLDGAAFMDRVEPVLYAKAKGTVKQALRLITAFAKADPALAGTAALTAAAGLEHSDADVQEVAYTFVATFGDPANEDLRAVVRDRLDVTAAPLKPRILDWLGADAATETTSAAVPDEDLSDLVARAKSLPPELAKAAGIETVLADVETPADHLPGLRFDGLDIPRLSEESRIAPVEDLDTLIGLFLQALEAPNDIELHERVLDGLVRLCGERPDDFDTRTAPITKRLARLRDNGLIGLYDGSNPDMLLAGLADAWLHGRALAIEVDRLGEPALRMTTPESSEKTTVATYGIGGVFLLRAADATRAIATRMPNRLLSTPTHLGGWILPTELVARSSDIEAASDAADLADRVLALLRLASDGRDAALEAARDLGSEWGSALRYALGGEEPVGETAALWVAAARSRAPFADDPAVEARFPKLGPGAGQTAKLDYFITSRTEKPYTWYFFNIACAPEPAAKLPSNRGGGGAPGLLPTVMAHRNSGYVMLCDESGFNRQDRLTTGYGESPWGPMLWPANPDVLFASTARDTAENLDDPRAASAPPYAGYRVAMDPDTPLTRMAYVMLTLGLNARDAAEGQMATDLLIAAAGDGRLDARALGAELRALLFPGMCKPKRWADRLGDAAQASPLHAATVRLALELALQGEAGAAPRDVHALMELLHALCVEQGEAITARETRDYLGAIKGGGKAAKLAKTLLALVESDPLPHRGAAAARALAARIERAERWAGRL